MSTRVLVTLESGASPEQVAEALTALGATEVRPPQPELPDVCIATVDEHQHSPAAWATEAGRLPGVASAEVDQLRWSM
jgi:hypothetical protein